MCWIDFLMGVAVGMFLTSCLCGLGYLACGGRRGGGYE